MSDTFEGLHYYAEIGPDADLDNPREVWDNAGIMATTVRRMSLPNEANVDFDAYGGWDELEAAIIELHNPLAMLPVYGYIHGGLVLNTTGFSCPWDSGQVGFIFITEESADAVGLPDRSAEALAAILRSEVEIFSTYLNGAGYEVSVYAKGDPDRAVVEYCGGFYAEEDAQTYAGDAVEAYDIRHHSSEL